MSRQFRFLCLAAVLALGACASPNVRLYDGAARPAADVAIVTMPEQLEVASINGTDVPGAKGMWNKGEKRLELLPGRYEALIYYREVWQAAGDSDVLRSKRPALFTIDAVAGHRYRIDYTQPGTYADARRLADDFQGWIVDENTGVRVASTDSGVKFREGLLAQVTGDSSLVQASPEPAAHDRDVQPVQPLAMSPSLATPTAPAAPAAATPVAAGAKPSVAPPAVPAAAPGERDWVTLMKGWWKQATPDERRDFLRWVGEQP